MRVMVNWALIHFGDPKIFYIVNITWYGTSVCKKMIQYNKMVQHGTVPYLPYGTDSTIPYYTIRHRNQTFLLSGRWSAASLFPVSFSYFYVDHFLGEKLFRRRSGSDTHSSPLLSVTIALATQLRFCRHSCLNHKQSG